MLMSPMPDVDTITRDDVETIAKAWWLLLVAGLMSVVIGVVILEVDWTAKSLAFVIGIVLIVRGIFDALTPSMDGAPRSWSMGSGVLSILVGVVMIAWPEPTLHVIAVIIGAWLLLVGIVEIVGAIANHRTLPMWGLALFVGIITTGIGLWALRRPSQTIEVIIVLVGIWSILIGALEIVAAFEVKRMPKDFDKMMASSS
jgi:uncharacterized membrane protein HdeD (DUF308 family)